MIENEANRDKIIEKVCEFLELQRPLMYSSTTQDAIKELCVARLCKAIGLTGVYNYKSNFFDFFSSVMGEAVCEVLSLKIHVAMDELRLFKYEHVNLVDSVKKFLETRSIEEAFIDAFDLADRFKYLIPKLKKV